MNFQAAFKGYDHAYNGMSFSPEKRIASDRAGFEADYKATEANLLKLAKSEVQKQVLRSEMARYYANYEKHFGAYLAAKSRCLSSMITGPANFPVRRNQKRLDIEHRRLEDFLAWHDKARKAMYKAILAARTPEEIAADEWEALKKSILRSVATIHDIDTGVVKGYSRPLFVSNLANRLKTLAQNGRVDLIRKALTLIKIQQVDFKKPIFTARHSVWKLEETARKVQAALEAKANQQDKVLAQFEGVELIACFADERLRFVFEGKPEEDTRRLLKSHGFRWSPKAGAWQRKLTRNARYAAQNLLEKAGFTPCSAEA